MSAREGVAAALASGVEEIESRAHMLFSVSSQPRAVSTTIHEATYRNRTVCYAWLRLFTHDSHNPMNVVASDHSPNEPPHHVACPLTSRRVGAGSAMRRRTYAQSHAEV